MNTQLVQKLRHGLIMLAIAAVLALATGALPTVLDQTLGTSLTTPVFACEVPGSGCG